MKTKEHLCSPGEACSSAPNQTTKYDEETLLDSAIMAYLHWQRLLGYIPIQPSRSSSEVEDGRVILRNVTGDLCQYAIDGDKLRGPMPVRDVCR